MEDILYFVYMVRCADETLYTGITKDINRRLRMHNGEITGGARYTRSRRPVKLVYTERQPCWKDAHRKESKLKRLSKKKKEDLVSGWLLDIKNKPTE